MYGSSRSQISFIITIFVFVGYYKTLIQQHSLEAFYHSIKLYLVLICEISLNSQYILCGYSSCSISVNIGHIVLFHFRNSDVTVFPHFPLKLSFAGTITVVHYSNKTTSINLPFKLMQETCSLSLQLEVLNNMDHSSEVRGKVRDLQRPKRQNTKSKSSS